MSSQIAAVRDAVVSALNTAAATPDAFTQTFTAAAKYVPLYDLAVGGLAVSVVPKEYLRENASRGGTKKTIDIDIGIQKRLANQSTTDPTDATKLDEIDELMEFAEQLADFFGPGYGEIGSTGFYYLRATIPDPLYDPDAMREKHAFQCVVTVTFHKP